MLVGSHGDIMATGAQWQQQTRVLRLARMRFDSAAPAAGPTINWSTEVTTGRPILHASGLRHPSCPFRCLGVTSCLFFVLCSRA